MSQSLRRSAEHAAAALPDLIIKAERAAMAARAGAHAQRPPGVGEKFWQFREYAPHDRPMDIDWRQSAKTDRVFIRQKERQIPQTALFWVCGAKSMNFSSSHKIPSKRESARVLSLALAILMIRGGERVGWMKEGKAGSSQNMLDSIAADMLADTDESPLPSSFPLRGLRGAIPVLVGDFLESPEVMSRSFAAFAPATRRGLVLQILDPAELELPYDGRARFEDMEAFENALVQNVPSIRERYKTRMLDHCAAVRHSARACGWDYRLHQTDAGYEETLMNIFSLFRF